MIQTGFARSTAILSAIYQEIPYLIMEAPIFRDEYPMMGASTFTYNGLQAGGTRPKAPEQERKKPKLLDGHDGKTIIIGQKPMDHSLRGSDHIAWLQEKMDEYPEAELRHHPLMVPKDTLEPIAVALSKCRRTISHTSTASVDSLIAGCEAICEHPANEAYGVGNREEWLHQLSWLNFTHGELARAEIAEWILSGYEQAEAEAEKGNQEIPREKVNGNAICRRYYSAFPEAV